MNPIVPKLNHFNQTRRICVWILLGLIFGWIGSLSTDAFASTPRLNRITPRGAQRGHEHQVTFHGVRLSTTEEVFFHDTGITATKFEIVDDTKVKVTLKIDADCRIGEHLMQLRTKRGISDFRSFFISEFPAVADKEPNNSFAAAQTIPMDVTVDGLISGGGDVDFFCVEGEQGQRLSVEIQAMRLGDFFDPLLELYDSEKQPILRADDSSFGKQDGFFNFLIPKPGKYFIKVRDTEFGGSANSNYRLHVGSFIRPTVAFPSGGKIGDKTKLTLIGDHWDNFEKTETEVTVIKSHGDDLLGLPTERRSPTPLLFRAVEFGNEFEHEPNDNFTQYVKKSAQKSVAPPIALNGIISHPKDHDILQFTATKDKTYIVKCVAQRIGSGLDTMLYLYSPTKKVIATSDDFKGQPDSKIEFKATATGKHYVRLRDHLFRGQPNFVYRIEITEKKPKISFGVKRVDRYSQMRQTVTVPQGGRYAVMFDVKKTLISGPVTLNTDSLPLGIRAQAWPLQNGTTLMPVVFEVDQDAELAGTLFDLTATGKAGDETIEGHFQNVADLALGPPNKKVYASGTINRLPMALVEPLPFTVDIEEPKVPLVRKGSMKLPIVVTRADGFDGNIRVELPFRPPGVGARGHVNIPKGKTTGSYPINANSKALLGNWPICVTATAPFGGPAWTSSNLKTLEIHEAFVAAQIDRISIDQGQSQELVCKLEHHFPFEGTATAKLLGLPPNVTFAGDEGSDTVSFDAATKEIRFRVITSDKSPVGKHSSTFCQLSIPKNGQQMVSKSANCTILIRPAKAKSKPKQVANKVSQQETP